ncbi:MAG: diaminopimelate epimerase [Gammaproteobacteria bacterium]|nr:MAG: diaminopimelate epimerase [Gammaproteobacteria bacterium]
MRVRFSKMHGLGNDFMVMDLVSQQVHLDPQLVARLGDRRTGVGFDQLLAVEPPTDPDADFFYRIYNNDGSEAQQCGNGARCFAAFINANGLSVKQKLRLQSIAGIITTTLREDGSVAVDMGVPSVEPADVPFATSATTTPPEPDDMAGPGQHISANGETYRVIPVSIGNPHAVLFVPSVTDADVERVGAALTRHDAFPEGANIGFCEVVDPGFMRLRVYERGVGETRACGTGACAAVVAAQLAGHCEQQVKVSLTGGKTRIHWDGPGQSITMTGPACLVYEGQITL